MSDISWLGNRVQLEEIGGTDLTYLQWRRPWHGSLRGYLVVGSEERALVEAAVDDAAPGPPPPPRPAATPRASPPPAGPPISRRSSPTSSAVARAIRRRPSTPRPRDDR